MNCYIHVPFCRSKCGYCAFYSEPGASEELISSWLDKVICDMEKHPDIKAETVYIGGGTPTLPDASQLERLLDAVMRFLSPVSGCEITIESNPETLDNRKIQLLEQYVTRISLGVQSFDPALRLTLGRNCSSQALSNAISLIQQSSIKHFNCDLIYGIPGQTRSQWLNDLETVASCGVDHVSCYSLTPEEQSLLGSTFIIDDEIAVGMYHDAEKTLKKYGIERYEISNYALPGAECRHNINVWKGGKLAAFGPSGAGFDGVSRTINCENLSGWLNGAAAEKDELSQEARCREIFAVNLRTVRGWNCRDWCFSGLSWREISEIFSSAMESVPDKFYIIDGQNIRLTPDGLLYWNDIAERVIL